MKTIRPIRLILPYFGKLNNLFPFFLQSCFDNPFVDFLIFTDCDIECGQNVTVIKLKWEEFVNYIQSKFDFKISLSNPYKLCDFRPAYGYIFKDYLDGYNYWGHCDCDLIWGNMSVLIELCKQGFDRIGEYGHLVLYKNNEDVNNWFRSLYCPDLPIYKQIFSDPKSRSFDEFSGMNKLVNYNNCHTFNPRLFDDIIFYSTNLFSRRKYGDIATHHNMSSYYEYNKGKLIRHIKIGDTWFNDDSLYIHLQKRPMEIKVTNTSHYYILSNTIVDVNLLSDDEIKKAAKPPFFDIKYYSFMFRGIAKLWLNKLSSWI